jgi:hypothetical protein
MFGSLSALQYSQDTSGDFFVILIQVLRGDVVFRYLACDHFGNIRVVCVFYALHCVGFERITILQQILHGFGIGIGVIRNLLVVS